MTKSLTPYLLTVGLGAGMIIEGHASSPEKTCDALPLYEQDLRLELSRWDPLVLKDIKRIYFIGEQVVGNENAFYNDTRGELGIIVETAEPLEKRRENIRSVHHELGHHVYEQLSDFFLDAFLANPRQPATIQTPSGYSIIDWNVLTNRMLPEYLPASCAQEFVELAYFDLPDLTLKLRIIEPHHALAEGLLEARTKLFLREDELKILEEYGTLYNATVPKLKKDVATSVQFIKESYGSSYPCLGEDPLRQLLREKGVAIRLDPLIEKARDVRSIFDRSIKDSDNEMYKVHANMIAIELDIVELERAITISPRKKENELFARAVQSLMTAYTGQPARGVFSLDEEVIQAFTAIDYNGIHIFQEPTELYEKARSLTQHGVSARKIEQRLFGRKQRDVELPPISCYETKEEFVDAIIEANSSK